jgi:outer membrane protein assembly factor BamB
MAVMKRFLVASLVVVLATTPLAAQLDQSRVYTNAVPPSREVLNRLNLNMAWRTYVPVDGLRDGLGSVHLTGKYVLAQTRSGLVTQIDADSGRINWRTRVGNSWKYVAPLAYNKESVFVINGTALYALDRKDGSTQWMMPLPYGVSAAPVADDEQIYIPTVTNRLLVYHLPNLDKEKLYQEAKREAELMAKMAADSDPKRPRSSGYGDEKMPLSLPPKEIGRYEKVGPQPQLMWTTTINAALDFPPVLINVFVVVPTSKGGVYIFNRNQLKDVALPSEPFRGDGTLLAVPGFDEEVCYIGAADSNLYALDPDTVRPRWRYTTGQPVYRTPFVAKQDVFVVSERNGLARVDRNSGEPQWRVARGNRVLNSNPDVDRVLAVNPKWIYAADRSGNLLVLDRARGAILSRYDTRDFVIPLVNDLTDRLFLAANNGLIVCLHDREYTQAYSHRDQENSMEKRLARLVSIPPQDKILLRLLLKNIESEYRVKILISKPAYKERGLEPIDDKQVSTRERIENVSVKEAIQKILDVNRLKSTVFPYEDTLLILPVKKDAKQPDDEKPPDNDKPPPEKEKPPGKDKEKDK